MSKFRGKNRNFVTFEIFSYSYEISWFYYKICWSLYFFKTVKTKKCPASGLDNIHEDRGNDYRGHWQEPDQGGRQQPPAQRQHQHPELLRVKRGLGLYFLLTTRKMWVVKTAVMVENIFQGLNRVNEWRYCMFYSFRNLLIAEVNVWFRNLCMETATSTTLLQESDP